MKNARQGGLKNSQLRDFFLIYVLYQLSEAYKVLQSSINEKYFQGGECLEIKRVMCILKGRTVPKMLASNVNFIFTQNTVQRVNKSNAVQMCMQIVMFGVSNLVASFLGMPSMTQRICTTSSRVTSTGPRAKHRAANAYRVRLICSPITSPRT